MLSHHISKTVWDRHAKGRASADIPLQLLTGSMKGLANTNHHLSNRKKELKTVRQRQHCYFLQWCADQIDLLVMKPWYRFGNAHENNPLQQRWTPATHCCPEVVTWYQYVLGVFFFKGFEEVPWCTTSGSADILLKLHNHFSWQM